MFPQPLTQQELTEAFIANIYETLEYYTSQVDHVSIQWIHNMDTQFKPGFKCVKDNKRHMNRRTIPKTNETDRRGQPLPSNVMGSMSFNK